MAASERLRALARRNADVYVRHCAPRAILLAGSTASGQADGYSDLDLIVYYDRELPSVETLALARAEIGGQDVRDVYPRREAQTAGEAYRVDGIECEVGHRTIPDLEARTLSLLDSFDDLESPSYKAIMGMQYGIALHGSDVIGAWQARINAFPEPLARAMVAHYASALFPLWFLADALAVRDAELWVRQTLAESAMQVLGVLAGVNRRYFSAFQFKRTRAFVATLEIAPPHLAERLEALVRGETPAAIAELEALWQETLALVEEHMPEVDLSALRHRPGSRQKPWTSP